MALYFAGSNGNYAEITNAYNLFSNLQSTISFWVKPLYDYSIIMATQTASLGALFVEANNVAGSMYIGVNGTYPLVSNAAFVSNSWVHVAITGGGSSSGINNALIYVNGVVYHVHLVTAKWSTLTNKSIYVGRFDSGTFPMTGHLQDIRVWNRTLTSFEVYQAYCNQDVTSGLTERWKLDETSGSTFAGSIGGYTGTITGTPSWSTVSLPYGSLGGGFGFGTGMTGGME